MNIGLLIHLATLAVKALLPEAAADAAALPGLVGKLVKDIKGGLPPITHDDGTPISLDELDAIVEQKAAAAHAAVHAGDLPADPSKDVPA